MHFYSKIAVPRCSYMHVLYKNNYVCTSKNALLYFLDFKLTVLVVILKPKYFLRVLMNFIMFHMRKYWISLVYLKQSTLAVVFVLRSLNIKIHTFWFHNLENISQTSYKMYSYVFGFQNKLQKITNGLRISKTIFSDNINRNIYSQT